MVKHKSQSFNGQTLIIEFKWSNINHRVSMVKPNSQSLNGQT